MGSDIPSGEYVITPNQNSTYCSYKLTSDSEGINVISEENNSTRIYITLTDNKYLEINGLANPISNAPKYIPISGIWSNGTFLVGEDVSEGNYEIILDDSTNTGSYTIMKDSLDKPESIIKNNTLNHNDGQEQQIISLEDGQYIKLNGLKMYKSDKPDNYVTSQWEQNENIPIVTYDDIKSGTYNDSDVKIEGIVCNIEVDSLTDYIDFDVWFQSNGKFVCPKHWMLDRERIDKTIYEQLSQNIQEGQHCIFTVNVYADSSFGSSSVKNIEFTEKNTPMSTIKETYTYNCTRVNGEDVARNPDNYKGLDISFSGEVFQIITEDDNNVEFLLDTGGDNGMVYVTYTIPKGSNRILKGDQLTVYGTFYIMKSYTSVLGTEQNVPSITAEFVS